MRTDKQSALKLRLQGKSYNEIRHLLSIPKSTLSGWFRDMILPHSAQERLKKRFQERSLAGLLKQSIFQTQAAQNRARTIRTQAKNNVGSLSSRDLKIAGIALYWAEGYKRPIVVKGKIKTHHPVRMSNSDPYLVALFLRFLREICQVSEERIRVSVHHYEHQNTGYLLEFWSRTTGISSGQFKSFYNGISKSSLGRRPYNTLPYGTVQIGVNDTALYHKIMGWIDGLSSV